PEGEAARIDVAAEQILIDFGDIELISRGRRDAGRKLRGVAGRIGRRRRDDLTEGDSRRHRNGEGGMAAGVGHDGARAEKELPFHDAVLRVGITGVEVDAKPDTRRTGLIQSPLDYRSRAGWRDRAKQRKILKVIRVAGRAMALRVIGSGTVILRIRRYGAQVNAGQKSGIAAAVLKDGIALDGIARVGLAGRRDRIA